MTLAGNKLSLLKKSYARLLDTEGMLPACLLLFCANDMPRYIMSACCFILIINLIWLSLLISQACCDFEQ